MGSSDPSPKSRDRRWQVVAGAYRAAGLTPHLDEACLASGYVYDKGEAALDIDPLGDYGVGLHDLAHYLVAPKYRQRKPNFGLGKHPSAKERRRAPALVERYHRWLEEFAATIVNVLLADVLFGRRHARHVARALKLRRLWARSLDRLRAAPYQGSAERAEYRHTSFPTVLSRRRSTTTAPRQRSRNLLKTSTSAA